MILEKYIFFFYNIIYIGNNFYVIIFTHFSCILLISNCFFCDLNFNSAIFLRQSEKSYKGCKFGIAFYKYECTRKKKRNQLTLNGKSNSLVRPISQNFVPYCFIIMLVQPSGIMYSAAGDTLLFKMKLSVRIWVARICFAKKRRGNRAEI